jgi:SAM-dependent methyltransferase
VALEPSVSRGARHVGEAVGSGRALEEAVAKLDRTIHPDCEMFAYARTRLASDEAATDYFFESAERVVGGLLEFLDDRGLDPGTSSILDFASGYGRFTRYFALLFERVTVADTEPAMLAFNERFGAAGFLSPPHDTDAVKRHPGRYDVVFCFSLFTHLTEAVWPEWFGALFRLVATGGHLIVSTHGYELFALLDPERFAAPGQPRFTFIPVNETTGRLDPSYYGTAVVSEAFVRGVAERVPQCRFVRRFGMGEFDRYHDVYAFERALS